MEPQPGAYVIDEKGERQPDLDDPAMKGRIDQADAGTTEKKSPQEREGEGGINEPEK